jgi:hypothetical protein
MMVSLDNVGIDNAAQCLVKNILDKVVYHEEPPPENNIKLSDKQNTEKKSECNC